MSAKILIVDDDPGLLSMIEYTLQFGGYEADTAKDGMEALSKIQAEKPDLVILDIMLPGMSGIEVCQQIREKLKMEDLPIIMLSARGQVPDKIKGLEAGADEYITKPVHPDEMIARVKALLERTRRLREAQVVKKGKVLGFIGAKGGVGTTTIALNVASALVKREKMVIAVELRSYLGAFALHLGLTPTANLAELLDLEPERIDERQLKMRLVKHPSGLRVLFGPQKVAEYKEIAPEQVEAVVGRLIDIADYIVLDLPCHPSPATRAALQLCDSVILVVESEPTSLIAGKTALELLKSWNIAGAIVQAAVVNRTRGAVSLPLAEIRAQLGCEIVGFMAPAPELSMKALELGRPLVLSEPDSTAALSLNEMTERLMAEQVIALS